jgi:hypothetical protein
MKKGKSVKLSLLSNAKTRYGTVDAKDFKSIYINIQSWVLPKPINSNWERIVSQIKREIKYTVNDNLNLEIYKDFFIVDLDLRFSGILSGKKSFFNLEITLFTKDKVEFKSLEVKESIKNLIQNIYIENISSNKYFDFFIAKKSKDEKQSDFVYLSKKVE